MKKLKSILSLAICAIAILSLGFQRVERARTPNLERAIDSSFKNPRPNHQPITISKDTPLTAESNAFGLDSVEVANANIETEESSGELYEEAREEIEKEITEEIIEEK